MRKTPLFFIIFLIVFIASAIFVSAHGSGQSFEREVGEYLLDIGTSDLTIRAGQATAFDFDILQKDSRELVPFTNMWVRFEDDTKLLFAGGISKASFGRTAVTYAFPKAGSYMLTVRFHNESETLAETSFPITVEQPLVPESGKGFSFSREFLGGGFIGLIIGAVIVFMIKKKTG